MANILTAPAATYADAAGLRGITKNDAVARSNAEVATYCTGDWANDVDDDLIDINEWFVGTTAGGIAGNTTQLLGNFSLTAASPTLTVGDANGSPGALFQKTDAGTSSVEFRNTAALTENSKRVIHNASENLVIQHRTGGGTWSTVVTVGADAWGVFGSSSSQAAAYTPTNVSTDRSYDANSTSTAELADVLGTLIADLQAYGLLQ